MPIFLSNTPILLRAVEPSDLDLLFEAENDIHAWPDADTHAPLSHEALSRYIDSYTASPFTDGQLRMIIEDTETSSPVGILDLYDISPIHRRAFVGIYIAPEHRQKGYASAALSAATRYARNRLNLNTLAAKIRTDNKTSLHLFESATFQRIATLPAWHFANGQFHDIAIFTRNTKDTAL